MLKSYLRKIHEVVCRGDAREESFYAVLEQLLNEYAKSIGKKNVYITTQPKKTEAGNPDFRIWDGKHCMIGYIEAKSPTIENLDHIEKTPQIKRYRHTFPNLILTNFLEFRLYRNGILTDTAQIGRPFILNKLKTILPVEDKSDFFYLLEKFFSFSLPIVYNAQELAIELAKRTRFLKDEVISQELKEEEELNRGFILEFYEAFRKYLINGLSKEAFADLFSQTVTYGLFASRTRLEDGFNRKLAYYGIPQTIGILRDIFRFISLEDLPPRMEWIIDDISEVLAVTDVKNILHQYFNEGKGKDPIFHFYETFLAEYSPETREKRGVYYTPEPVVSYIVHSLHTILKDRFDKPDGFASRSVTVLDPAAGTLTFLAETVRLAIEEYVSKHGDGGKEEFIKEHILENFYAFELLMAAYSAGHLKMSYLLEELGYKLRKNDRLKLYLTNTLEMENIAQIEIPGLASLSRESRSAGEIKKKQPILVILGNPPYSGHSSNVGKWISGEIKAYYQVDGRPLSEKNPKWLQDDYVKFIRFAQWKIDRAGEGILGFITNHSYLDNPTFRGMRQSLMNSFDKIYILNLHGNSLKKEKCPDGSKDENVFEIRQGVAIAFFIKKKDKEKECKVYHSEIWGAREKKYEWLKKNDIKTTRWQKLAPRSKFYLFTPGDEKLSEVYEKYTKITDIFPVNSVGIVTARDHLTIKWTPEEVWAVVLNFSKMDNKIARLAYNLGKDTRDWKVELAQKDLINSGMDKTKIVPILYRPFDIRYTYYTGKSRGFLCMPRPEVMKHMMKENLGLCVGRAGQVVGLEKPWNIVFCSNCVIDLNLFYRGGNVTFPLYIYLDNNDENDLLNHLDDSDKMQANINPRLFKSLSEIFKKEIPPEEIFYYIYAILYSKIYRIKYAEFIKIDFPGIPFTGNYKLFGKMAEYGKRLVSLHMPESTELDKPISKFQGRGDNKVEKLRYDKIENRIYINQNQYFEGITGEIWHYQIGGYQVCHKWLKDRKGRLLSLDDITHYCRIITSLQRTIETQKEIDNIYLEVEKGSQNIDLSRSGV